MPLNKYNYLILEELYRRASRNGTVAENSWTRRMANDEEWVMEEEFIAYAACLSYQIDVLSAMNYRLRDSKSCNRRSDSMDYGLWRLLDKTGTTEHHEKILGNGYLIITNPELHSDET